jgi:hypothetical protein
LWDRNVTDDLDRLNDFLNHRNVLDNFNFLDDFDWK